MQYNNQGSPPALTHENLAAAIKRADDAEDSLRREVASYQALAAMIRERDTVKACRVIIERDETIFRLQSELLAHSEMIKARDQMIADLKDDLQSWKDRALTAREGS